MPPPGGASPKNEPSKQAIPLPPPDETTALNSGEKKSYTEGMFIVYTTGMKKFILKVYL